MRKLALVFTGLMVLGGVARADDSVLIGDTALDAMTAGTLTPGCLTACIDINKSVWSNLWSNVHHYSDIHGFAAESIGDAVARGPGAITVTTNRTFTDPYQGVSQSSGYAASYSNPVYYGPPTPPPCCLK